MDENEVHPGNLGDRVVMETLRLKNNNFMIFYLPLIHTPQIYWKAPCLTCLLQYHKNALALCLPNWAESYPGLDLHQAEGHSADRV